ncbi:DNA primase, partial [Streptococcus pseudopneumoniae]|nr:DNA primase [Streptococcus pseudopneumoniae]
MNSDDIVNKIIEENQQREPIKAIEESESYLTTFKGVQGFLFNVCKNLGEDRPSKSL